MAIKWRSFSKEEPTLALPIYVVERKRSNNYVFTYGPITAHRVLIDHGFYPGYWVYIKDIATDEDED